MKTILGSMGLLLVFSLAAAPNAGTCSPLAKSDDASSESEPDDRVPAQSEIDESKVQEGKNGQGLYRFFGAIMFAASAGDLASTEWGLSKPGIYETNPLAMNRNVRVTAHVLVPTVVWWATNKMRKNGHHKAALWIRIGVTAAYGYAVMHNLRTAGSASPIY